MSLSKSARNSDEQLFALLDEIVGRGDEPSVRTLHKAAGGGSYARLRKVFELWEKALVHKSGFGSRLGLI